MHFHIYQNSDKSCSVIEVKKGTKHFTDMVKLIKLVYGGFVLDSSQLNFHYYPSSLKKQCSIKKESKLI